MFWLPGEKGVAAAKIASGEWASRCVKIKKWMCGKERVCLKESSTHVERRGCVQSSLLDGFDRTVSFTFLPFNYLPLSYNTTRVWTSVLKPEVESVELPC